MKSAILFTLLQALCLTPGFSQNPRWRVFGKPIPAREDLNVRWQATNNLPTVVWVYRLLPNRLSTQTLSNILEMCSLPPRSLTAQGQNVMVARSDDGLRKLSVSFTDGAIRYETPERQYGPTNLAVGVPTLSEIPLLATNVLSGLGINLQDIKSYSGSAKFYVGGPETWFFVNDSTITNIPYRTVSFRRAIDHMPVSGGDGGSIDVGPGGMICRISISWRKVERIKSFPTYSGDTVVRLLRQGKVFQGLVPGNVSDLDWSTVKGAVITDARPCYCSGKSDLLYPFLALTATVETDGGKFEMELDSPVIDEAQPLTGKWKGVKKVRH